MTQQGSNIYLQWDEENRLRLADMPQALQCAYYQYDASGERFYKNVGVRDEMINNGHTTIHREYGNPVLYASPYMVIANNSYTKHYFVDNERFASRIGDGDFSEINTHSVSDSLLTVKQTLTNNAAPQRVAPNKFSFLNSLSANWSTHHTTYWQHPDHLGSASWVTDTNGHGYQHLQYRVWGEPFIDQRTTANGYETRYTFSGKERDGETGYSYFGARYYHSALSIWLSVDPMADKYPSTSPYTYCANNPVRLVDPNGRELSENLDKWRYNRSDGTLMWISDEGGSKNQTVEFVHNNKQDGKLYYDEIKSINYDGYIGDMFNFSVVSPKIDGIISGALDIYNGGKTFVAGVALEVGTEGAATPVAVSLCFVGGAQLADGFRTLVATLSGENGKYSQQNLVKDLCKTGINSVSDFAKGFSWKNLFKSLRGAVAGAAWTYQLSQKANYPQFKGNPSGSKITYSH